MSELIAYLEATCPVCGHRIVDTREKRRSLKDGRQIHCSAACARLTASIHLRKMAHLSRERMNTVNPMRDPEVRLRVSEKLRAMGHMPRIRGGNGKGLTEAERTLLDHMGDPWVGNHIVATRVPRGRGIPTHYKLDLAHPDLRIAVEVDGPSHQALSVKKRDDKKTAFLTARGWMVLRFLNSDVKERLLYITCMLNEIITTLQMDT